MLNLEQFKGIVERLVTIAVVYAVGKGWITTADSANIITGVVALASVGWGWWVNTHSSLTTAATNVGTGAKQ